MNVRTTQTIGRERETSNQIIGTALAAIMGIEHTVECLISADLTATGWPTDERSIDHNIQTDTRRTEALWRGPVTKYVRGSATKRRNADVKSMIRATGAAAITTTIEH